MDMIMTGFAGVSGTRTLAIARRSFLLGELPSSIVTAAGKMHPSWDIPDGAGFVGRVKIKEGGIFRALWILSQKLQCGFEIDLRKIPVLQETVEVCEVLEEDIFSLPAGDAWIAATAKPQDFLARCAWAGIPASVIGKTTRSMARAVYLGDAVRYLVGP